MTKFLMDVVATVVGVCLVFLIYALAASDMDTKLYCDLTTSNPVGQTSCIVAHTLK